MVDSIEFDSATKAAFYQKLKRDLSVELIEVQPEFLIVKPYQVACKRCSETGDYVFFEHSELIEKIESKGEGMYADAYLTDWGYVAEADSSSDVRED